jgi:heat shock protein HslJ
MRQYATTAVVIALILVGCGCKTSKKNVGDEHYPLVGTQWNLVKLDGAEIGVDFALRPFITFDTADNIQGNLGCNSFFGTYSTNKRHKMTLEFQGATKRLCQNMGVERKFMQALKRDISRYEIVGEELILFEGDQEVMRFTGVDLSKVE